MAAKKRKTKDKKTKDNRLKLRKRKFIIRRGGGVEYKRINLSED